jgi:beta-lactamase superfamily II metal-dependent hydrolase
MTTVATDHRSATTGPRMARADLNGTITVTTDHSSGVTTQTMRSR